MQPAREYLALDLGKKRTGIARASSVARIVEPIGITDTAELMEKLTSLIAKNNVELLVVGLPRSLNGSDTEQTEWVKQWAKEAQPQLKVPIVFQDEAMTTVLAEQRKQGRADDEAACIILQDYLEENQ